MVNAGQTGQGEVTTFLPGATMAEVNQCCFVLLDGVRCNHVATYEISEHGTSATNAPDGSGTTYACDAHLQDMMSLGGKPLSKPFVPQWTVRSLDWCVRLREENPLTAGAGNKDKETT